ITGTVMLTLEAFWNVSTSRTLEPPVSGRIRPSRTTLGAGPVRRTAFWLARLTLPPGSVTDLAVPGAEFLTSLSAGPLLIRARNTPAEPPALIVEPIAAPSTNTFLIAMSLCTVPVPSVGWCHSWVGALFPASQPARAGISAASARTSRRRPAGLRLLRITACSPLSSSSEALWTPQSVVAAVFRAVAGPRLRPLWCRLAGGARGRRRQVPGERAESVSGERAGSVSGGRAG